MLVKPPPLRLPTLELSPEVKRVRGRDQRGCRHRVPDHRHEVLDLGGDVTGRILREPFRRQVIRHEALRQPRRRLDL
jgi:hypothetical protein